MSKLILASSSPYRRELLARLNIPFEWHSPDIDETPFDDESGESLVRRLSIAKANAIASSFPKNYVIGSDQVAVFDNKIIGKPYTHEKASMQLAEFSGNTISFITGLFLVNQSQQEYYYQESVVQVKFRSLSAIQIENYLKMDMPYDCAGSFKVESAGISLFESIISDDPTSLEGLPLIALCNLFERSRFQPYNL
ncbi:MAG: Maf family nucleotide pyrophosphatase [Kangiellaceae bacterium]|nr:Maf family nucleotide pyrophosphatase [Kangiellaceae bacterium]